MKECRTLTMGIRLVKQPFMLSRYRCAPEGAYLQVTALAGETATVKRVTGEQYSVPAELVARNTREVAR